MIDVIYVAGEGRSGSTVLDRVLGSLPGVTSQNELYRVWQHGAVENLLCACGKRFASCPYWCQVVERLGGIPDLDREFALQRNVERSRVFPQLYFGLLGPERRMQLAEYEQRVKRLYTAVVEASGNSIIVDSSKVPGRALVLARIPGFRVHVIHLIRDARAVVYAWTKRTKRDPARQRDMRAYNPIRVIGYWILRNLFAAMLARRLPYTRVYYEDLVVNPRLALERLVASIPALADKSLTFLDDQTISLGPLHTMSGNPGRFKTGPERLVADDEWHRRLSRSVRIITTLLTGPLLLRYGYLSHRQGDPQNTRHPSMASHNG